MASVFTYGEKKDNRQCKLMRPQKAVDKMCVQEKVACFCTQTLAGRKAP